MNDLLADIEYRIKEKILDKWSDDHYGEMPKKAFEREMNKAKENLADVLAEMALAK